MSDLIKREDAIKALRKLGHEVVVIDKVCSLGVTAEFIDAIRAIPSADRPQGEWKVKSFHECFCHNCGFSFDIMKCEFLENMKYCPNCDVPKGADNE